VIAQVGSTSPACAVALTGPRGPASQTAALLPEPGSPLSGASLNDAMGALYLALSKQRQLSLRSDEATVQADQSLRDKDLTDEMAALARQMANEADSGRGFFDSIGHLFDDMARDFAGGRLGNLFDDIGADAEQAWNSPAFWNDLEKGAMAVAKVALVVASVAATLATAGRAILIAGCGA